MEKILSVCLFVEDHSSLHYHFLVNRVVLQVRKLLEVAQFCVHSVRLQ